MNIIVCAKQVPAGSEVRLDPETNTIVRDGSAAVINPFDSHALEAALCLREARGGEVSVLSMGIPACEDMLRDCAARGADRTLLLTDRAFAGSDTLATAYALSLGVRALGDFDLILCGRMAVDGDTAQIGPELAERLGIPHVTDVCAIEPGEGCLLVRRETDDGLQRLRVPLPALLTVTRELGTPRLPSITGVLQSERHTVGRLDAAGAGADRALCGLTGSPTQVTATYIPQRRGQAREIAGTPAQQAGALARLIREGSHGSLS